MSNAVRLSAGAGLVALLVVAAALAQPLPPALLPSNLPVEKGPETKENPQPIHDPQVQPAQELGQPTLPKGFPNAIPDSPRATVPTGVTTTPGSVSAPPPEPPAPTVRLLVQTPAHVPPGKPVPYKIIVVNSSQATAYRVRVRVPAPEGAASLNKAEPKPDGAMEWKLPTPPPKEISWEFKSLAKGEQKVIELEYVPAQQAKDVRTRAYVSFEHGQEVTTQIEKPRLAVKRTQATQVARGEPVTVRVEVANTGPMPIHKVRLVEQATGGFEFRGDTDAERTDKTNQRVWNLGTIGRGQSKIVTYQLSGGKATGGELIATSNATSEDGGIAETAESKTKVLVPELGFTLTGPASVESRKVAVYEATVRNNGTLPLMNVVVSIPIPEDCNPTKVTTGAQRYKDRVSWVIPKMAPGDAQSYRLSVIGNTSGKRVIRATARDKSGTIDMEKEVASVFHGRADLHWKPEAGPAVLAVGKQGQVTITVKNEGEDSDKGVAPRIKLPDGLKVIESTPAKHSVLKDAGGVEVVFNAIELKAGQSEVFTVTVERTQPGPMRVGVRLEATSLGDRPMIKDLEFR